MTTSLDSSVLIDILNGRVFSLRERYLDACDGGQDFVISALVQHEVMFGVQLSARQEAQLRKFGDLFGRLPLQPFTADDALEAAKLRVELRRAGSAVETMDTLIAGQARARGWAVATGNLKHFTRMPDLVVEDWSA